jgi:hypothetical protein
MLSTGFQGYVMVSGKPLKKIFIKAIDPNDAIAWSGFQLGANKGLTVKDVQMLRQNGVDATNLPMQQAYTPGAKTKTKGP